jgi:allantoin racemase
MRLMFIRTSAHDYTTAYSHELIDAMASDGLLAGVEWDYDPGPVGPLVQNREDLVLVSAGVLERVRNASASGKFDALIVQGFLDPVIYASREVSRVPVLFCGESAVHMASLLGHRFSIVDTLECMAIMIRQNVELYGFGKKLASVRSIEYPVQEVMQKKDRGRQLAAMVEESLEAIEGDGADTIVIGCTALSWMVPEVRERLKERGYEVPVILPLRVAVAFARAMVSLGLRHSPVAYPAAAPKARAIPR